MKLTEAEKEIVENFEFVYSNGGKCVSKSLVELVEQILTEHVEQAKEEGIKIGKARLTAEIRRQLPERENCIIKTPYSILINKIYAIFDRLDKGEK